LNHRLAPALRAAAERTLRDRLPELELGERVTLGRLAPLLLLRALLEEEEHPRVVASILLNPRLPEADVLALVASPDTPPETLRLISESSRFGTRRAVELGLVKNRRTPVHVALRALLGLPRSALSAVVSRMDLPPLLRLGAERRLSGERPGGEID